jgi:beta-lactam-binding protein with PASTA domain
MLDRYSQVKNRVLANPRSRLALAASIITLGLLAAVGGYWFGIARYTTTPSLVNAAKPAAELMAQRSGFKIRYDEGLYSEKVPKDTVLAQHPAGGERILNGGTITLTLSRGPERYLMPDLIGKPYDLALQDAEKLRLVVQRTDTYSDAVLPGSVADTIPAQGTQVAPGATVTLKVSKGRAPITMPNVVGKNVNEARDQLQALGLQVAVKQADSDKPKDSVTAQDPIDGAGLEKGATVTLTVSNGPPLVEVPDVTGMDADKAKAELEKVGLKAKVLGAGNTVRIQSPGAHEKVPAGTEITLWVFA